MSDRPVLGFDTSAAHCAAALLCGGVVLAHRVEPMAKGQAERLFPLIEELLAEAGAGWSDLAAVGVGIGPGNFTGLRISVAAARGLALARGIPAIGVTGFDALAEGAAAPALTTIDARRGRSYAAGPGLEPVQLIPEELPPGLRGSGLPVIGHDADAFAAVTRGSVQAPARPVALAVTAIAGRRMAVPGPRPAPVYLRAPDAAPPADPPPVLLA